MAGTEHAALTERSDKATAHPHQETTSQPLQQAPTSGGLAKYILYLQRVAGNKAVSQLLQRYQAERTPASPNHRQYSIDHDVIQAFDDVPDQPMPLAATGLAQGGEQQLQRKLSYDQDSFATEFGKSTKARFKKILKLLLTYSGQYTEGVVNLDAKATLLAMQDVCNDLITKDLTTASAKHKQQKTATTNLLAAIATELKQVDAGAKSGRKAFDTLAKGGIKEAKAPDNIVLPDEMHTGMATAWGGSFPKGKSQEQGGIMVANKDGGYTWKAGDPGKSGSFTPDFDDVGADEMLVGSGHTHPYSKKEGGHTDVSFSGDDISTMVVTGEKLAIVQSGQSQFIVSSTKEFESLVKKQKTQEAKATLMQEMNDLWDEKFKDAEGTFQERVEEAVKALCAKYHLVYYKGSGGELTKQ